MGFHIVFKDLPAPTRRSSGPSFDHADAVQKLKAQPSEWAVVQERNKRGDAATAAYQIRKGILAAFRPAGSFEAKSRTEDGKFRVYARYIGEVSSSASDGR